MGITELLELRRQNLLTDEELAFAIKELKKKEESNNSELSQEDKETAQRINNDSIGAINLANQNRERAQRMRNEWAHRVKQEELSRTQDEELLLAKTVLSGLTSRVGERTYSDEMLNNMEYYETMSLYDSILEHMNPLERNKMVNEAKQRIKEGKGFGMGPVLEPATEPETVVEPEPVTAPDPVAKPDPVAALDPVAEPDPVAALDPVAEPDPVVAPDSVAEPDPVAEPDDLVAPLPLPGDDEPEVLPGFDDEPTADEDEPEIEPLPLPAENTPEEAPEPETLPAEDEEEKDKVVPIPVEVVQPKPSLWKKVVIITGAAITFLNGIAIAIHTGLMAKNSGEIKKDTSEIIGLIKEQDKDLDDDKSLDDNDSLNNNDTLSNGNGGYTPSGNTPGGNTPGGNTPGGNTPDQNTPDQNTPDQNTPDQNTPDQNTPDQNTPDQNTPSTPGTTEPGKTDDVFPIHLDPTQKETAMDTSTGVEVTADGTTYKHNADGTYSKIGDQDLSHDENGNALVNKDNLKDTSKPNVEVPKTGDEKPFDEAVKDMNEQEQKNLLDEAINNWDWDAFFEQSGPTR